MILCRVSCCISSCLLNSGYDNRLKCTTISHILVIISFLTKMVVLTCNGFWHRFYNVDEMVSRFVMVVKYCIKTPSFFLVDWYDPSWNTDQGVYHVCESKSLSVSLSYCWGFLAVALSHFQIWLIKAQWKQIMASGDDSLTVKCLRPMDRY